MPDTPDLFESQAKERPDASSPTGRKVVYEDDPEPQGKTLPDGRFDGEGEWACDALAHVASNQMTHNQFALALLYWRERITRRDFADACDEVFGKPSFKLPARIADLRQIDDAPPIVTDEETEPTTYYIPQADTDQ